MAAVSWLKASCGVWGEAGGWEYAIGRVGMIGWGLVVTAISWELVVTAIS